MDTELKDRLDRIEALSLLAAKNVLSVKDAALLTGRKEKTIRNHLSEIPHYYGPLGVCFDRKEFEQWMLRVKRSPLKSLIQ